MFRLPHGYCYYYYFDGQKGGDGDSYYYYWLLRMMSCYDEYEYYGDEWMIDDG